MSGETGKEVTGWTVDTLRYAMQQQIDDLKERLTERAEAQLEAMQTAHAAAEKALDERTKTLDKEFHEHLEQVRHENALALRNIDKQTAAALAAQKDAVSKAETAAEKRFEGQNEFRAQLTDQAATFTTRVESTAVQERNVERINDLNKQVADCITRSEATTAHDGMVASTRALQDRMNRMEGEDHGAALSKTSLYAAVGVIVAILGLVIIFANYASGR